MNCSLLKTPLWNGSRRGNYVWPESLQWTRHAPCSPLKGKKVKVLVTHLYLTLCNPVDCSLPGSSVHGILQSRILEWVAIHFSRGSSWPTDRTPVSCIAGRFFTTWATRDAPLREGITLQIWLWKDSSVEVLTWLLSWVATRWSCLPQQHFFLKLLNQFFFPPKGFILGLESVICFCISNQVSVSQCWSDNAVKRTMAKSQAAGVFKKSQASTAEMCQWKWTLKVWHL